MRALSLSPFAALLLSANGLPRGDIYKRTVYYNRHIVVVELVVRGDI